MMSHKYKIYMNIILAFKLNKIYIILTINQCHCFIIIVDWHSGLRPSFQHLVKGVVEIQSLVVLVVLGVAC